MATGAQTTLAIVHTEGSNPPTFVLTRSDGKLLAPVKILTPYEFPVEGSPQFRLMRQLRWYLERFLDYPYHPDTIAAEHVLDALKAWGSQAFNAIFDPDEAGEWLNQANIIQIKSDDPVVLSWPWEALINPKTGEYVVLQSRMERELNKLLDPPPTGDLPTDRVNILLVVARPYQNDVSYRSIARPLVDLIRTQNLPAHVDVLRPPTFDQLRTHLEEHPNYYHLLHFDGHGIYSSSRREGYLAFENKRGKEDLRSAVDINDLLRKCAVPAVVLNACQSATLDDKSEDPFATVATALLQSGIRSVVAMAYSLTVRGAQSFLPSFYSGLFKTGSIAEGVRAGRKQMLDDKHRISPRGPYKLEDWLLPVLYQQHPVDFAFAAQTPAQTRTEPRESRLPEEVLNHREDYEFVGRDGPILQLERALRLDRPGIVVQGLGGAGKTRLAREFLRWLDETGGLDTALWFDFHDIRSAEYVISRIGQLYYGENFGIAPNKPDLIAQALKQRRVIIVWDNFESAHKNLTSEDRAELGQFLDAIRSTKGKVIITSRSTEEWLPLPPNAKLALGGLQGEERWEYSESVLTGLGLKVNRDDSQLITLMNQLMGHPLAMRVVLPLLERMSADEIIEALRTNIADLGLSLEGEEGRILATLHLVEQDLPNELRPLLPLVGLHEAYISANQLDAIAKQVDLSWTRLLTDKLMEYLGSAGLVRDVGNAVYELHPLLTSYLRSRRTADEHCKRAFVDVVGRAANEIRGLELQEQRISFLINGPNFYFALEIAGSLNMIDHFGALTQFFATFARHSRDFVEASRLYQRLAQHSAARSWAEGQASAYHWLGAIAQEQGKFADARDFYLKSLAISEQLSNLDGAATTYHQLGLLTQKERDFQAAVTWYFKSLTISEKQDDLKTIASTHHQLGRVSEEQRDFANARDWYFKSLALSEKHAYLHQAATTYHQLGNIAFTQREFQNAREWYRKSIAVKEKQGDLSGLAMTYNQLGMLAEEQLDFESARGWYVKSLAISEQLRNLHVAASTYHQLGRLAEEQGDFKIAREWHLKSLALRENLGDLHAAASSHHQLGRVAEELGNLDIARERYFKSLEIKDRLGDLHGAASTYNQLGAIASKRRDYADAREWYLKALAIKENESDLHGAASTLGNLGIVAGLDGNMPLSGVWLVRSITNYRETKDERGVHHQIRNLLYSHQQASPEDRDKIESIWHEAGLGPFPTQPDS